MRKPRLAGLLFLTYLWVAVAAVVAMGLHGANVMRDHYLAQTDQDLEARAWIFGRQVVPLVEQGEYPAIDALCNEIGNAEGVATRMTVILPDGRVVGESVDDLGRMDNHRDRPEIRDALASEASVGRATRPSDTLDEERSYVAVAMRDEAGTPVAVVRASVPVDALSDTIGRMRREFILAALVATAIAIVLSLLGSVALSRPLAQMTDGAERFARGELDYRLTPAGSDETCRLAEAMNRMAGQLHERIRVIQRQKEEHEAMLAGMREGVLFVDDEGKIINFNDACPAILGIEPRTLKGRIIHDVLRQPELLGFLESVLDGSARVESDIQIFGTEEHWLRASGTVLRDAAGEKTGALFVLHDVTKLRHLETMRSDFAANVSHELRTPITSIKGFVETLLETLLDGGQTDPRDTERFLRIVLEQANRLGAIIEDLLSLSRIEKEAEQEMVVLAPGPIREVLERAVAMCERKAAEKNVRLVLDCDAILSAHVNAPLLEQAVVNLLDNAVKYSRPDRAVRIVAAGEDDAVVIRVEDEGCGIEARFLPRLFERFFRVDLARSREMGGTGLGLAIVKHIALAHHGSVGVESTVGQGSTFSIRLPVAPPEPIG